MCICTLPLQVAQVPISVPLGTVTLMLLHCITGLDSMHRNLLPAALHQVPQAPVSNFPGRWRTTAFALQGQKFIAVFALIAL